MLSTSSLSFFCEMSGTSMFRGGALTLPLSRSHVTFFR